MLDNILGRDAMLLENNCTIYTCISAMVDEQI